MLASVWVMLLATAACGSDEADSRSEAQGIPDIVQSLEAEEWVLDATDSSVDLPEDATATLTVAGDTVSGVGPCNSYGGPFTIDGDAVTIGPLAATLVGCEQALMDAQDDFTQALEAVDRLDLPDGRLVLSGPDDVHLAFDPLDRWEALLGSWSVVNLATADAVTGPIDGTDPTLEFADDGTLSVDTGCNTGSGGWELDGDRITIGPLATTQRACDAPEGVMQQEADLTAALEASARMSIAGDTLTLLREDGTITVVAGAAGG